MPQDSGKSPSSQVYDHPYVCCISLHQSDSKRVLKMIEIGKALEETFFIPIASNISLAPYLLFLFQSIES